MGINRGAAIGYDKTNWLVSDSTLFEMRSIATMHVDSGKDC